MSYRESLFGDDPSTSSDQPYELAYDLSCPSSTWPEELNELHRPSNPSRLCDSRLHQLDIRYWTDVRIENDMAAKCISLYLETDHPLLGHFDPDLFISDLISKRSLYCSSLLVNALMYWASVCYFLPFIVLVSCSDWLFSKCTVVSTPEQMSLPWASVKKRKGYGILNVLMDVTLF